MKFLFILLFAFSSVFALHPSNALESLVFDFSSELKELPEDGWISMQFSIVQYDARTLNVAFSATCLESGIELAFYPRKNRFQLNTGEELPITLFMNEECGMLQNIEAGEHSRVIRFQFIDVERNDTLAFDQTYVIVVK